jgi:hypothetical protein
MGEKENFEKYSSFKYALSVHLKDMSAIGLRLINSAKYRDIPPIF